MELLRKHNSSKNLALKFHFYQNGCPKIISLKIAQIWVHCDLLRFLNRAFVTEQRFGFLFSTDDLCSLSGPILTSSSHHPAMYHEGMLLQLFAAKEKTACLFFFFPKWPKINVSSSEYFCSIAQVKGKDSWLKLVYTVQKNNKKWLLQVAQILIS